MVMGGTTKLSDKLNYITMEKAILPHNRDIIIFLPVHAASPPMLCRHLSLR